MVIHQHGFVARIRMKYADAVEHLRREQALPGTSLLALSGWRVEPSLPAFKVVVGGSKAVAECLPALTAAADKDYLAALQHAAAVIG